MSLRNMLLLFWQIDCSVLLRVCIFCHTVMCQCGLREPHAQLNAPIASTIAARFGGKMYADHR
jgi:hypothetical protein